MTHPDAPTFGQFAALARQRGWTVDFLTAQFAGRFSDEKDPPRRFFGRVLGGGHADVAIPYDSVIAFYNQKRGIDQRGPAPERRCACGCGQHICGRQRFASAACRKRASRDRGAQSVTAQNGPKNLRICWTQV